MMSVHRRLRLPAVRPIAIRALALAAFALAAPAAALAGPWVMPPGDFVSEVRAGYYTTATFYDNDGERPDLPGGSKAEARGVRWTTELGWKKFASVRFELPFESQTLRIGPDVQPEVTRTGLSDLLVGFNVNLKGGPTAVALEANWKAPLGYNKDLPLPLGNGHQEAIGFLHVGTTVPAFNGFIEAAGGYRAVIDSHDNPTDPNNQTLATADAGFWLGNSLLVSGAYRGRFEADDTGSGSLTAATTATEHLVGPQLTYRVDDYLDVFFGSLHTASGKNVLHRNVFYVGITTHKTHYDRLRGFVGNKQR